MEGQAPSPSSLKGCAARWADPWGARRGSRQRRPRRPRSPATSVVRSSSCWDRESYHHRVVQPLRQPRRGFRGGDLEIRCGRTVPQCPVQFRYVKSRSDLESLTYAKSTNPLTETRRKLNHESRAGIIILNGSPHSLRVWVKPHRRSLVPSTASGRTATRLIIGPRT